MEDHINITPEELIDHNIKGFIKQADWGGSETKDGSSSSNGPYWHLEAWEKYAQRMKQYLQENEREDLIPIVDKVTAQKKEKGEFFT
mgnify:CR=1 FL=1